MKKILTFISCFLLAVGFLNFSSCSTPTIKKNTLTVSIPPQKYLLKKIVGNKFEVYSLLPPGMNTEHYDPTINQLSSLQKSKAFFRIGNIGYETASIQKISENFPDVEIINTAKGISYIYGTHNHHHGRHHHDVDPHIWSSVKNAKIIAKNMYDAIIVLDPSNKKLYTQNFENLNNELDALNDSIAKQLESHKGETFIVWHPSLSYFARDYGLKQLSIEYEGKEISAKQLQTKIDAAKATNPKIFFFQKEYDSRQSEVISNEIGTKLIPVNLLSEDWKKEMLFITNAFTSETTD